MIACYSLRPVWIDGVEMMGRPISWDRADDDGFGHDDRGADVIAIGFHTTCPHCGSLVEFTLADVVIASDGENVTCNSCNKGKKGIKLVDQPAIPIAIQLRDPISTGLFPEADLSRLVPKLSQSVDSPA